MLHLNLNDNTEVKRVCQKAFPDYTGRTFKVRFGVKKMSVRSYWDGGSRSYYTLVRLADLECHDAPTSHPIFDKVSVNVDAVEIPEGFVIVEHSYFCGKDSGLTIHTPVERQQLSSGETSELSEDHYLVLIATVSRKSSYAGISDYRKHSLQKRGLTGLQVDTLRQELIDQGYMAKNKSITNKGKNAISDHPLRMRF